jgi:hypothetical protein
VTALVLPLPGAETLAARLAAATGEEPGGLELPFPDGGPHPDRRLGCGADGRSGGIAGPPDGKILPLLFATATCDLGAEWAWWRRLSISAGHRLPAGRR